MEVNPEDSMWPKVGVIFTRFGKRRPSPFVVDLYREFREQGETKARYIAEADDPRHYKVNVEDYLK